MSTTSAARTTRRRSAALVASCAVVGLLLTGCAASGGSDSSAAVGDRGVEAPAPAVGSGGVVTDSSGEGEGEGKGDGGTSPLEASLARSVIVRADMTVRVDDLDAAYAAMSLAAGRHGAVIASQTTSEGDLLPEPMPVDEQGMTTCPSTGCPTSYASSTTTYRVDNDEVDDLIRDLGDLGTVEASYRTTDDVTGQVADVDARLETARASLARVRVLMDKAVTIADVVALEAELSRRQADLESLQAQQRVLADQTAQATVTVRLVDEQAPVVVEDETGFLAGLSAGWNAFTGAAVVALTVIGALIPFLLVLVPLGLLIWWLVRRGSRPVAPVAQPAPPVETV